MGTNETCCELLSECSGIPLATDFVTDVADIPSIRYIRYPSAANLLNLIRNLRLAEIVMRLAQPKIIASIGRDAVQAQVSMIWVKLA